MATPTPRLSLTRDDGTDNYSVTRVNNNSDKIDAAIGSTWCTSGTRPSSPFQGQKAYETDTAAEVVYSGSAWKYVGPAVVASKAARDALTPKHHGLICYRTDRNWYEVWDSSIWRIQGTANCSSTTDRDTEITSFYTGMTSFTTDTNTLWRRQSSSWVPYAVPPTVELRQVSGQTISNAGWNAINFSEETDTHAGHSDVTNPSRYTAPLSGRYWISGGVGFAVNATGSRGSMWTVNGVEMPGSQILLPACGGGLTTIVPARSRTIFLTAGDYLQLNAYQNSGGNLSTTVSNSDQPGFSAFLVGGA